MTILETLKQVRLLLRRNFALHIRQPVILALELLWPILIFLVVMAARNSIPPVAHPTCHYKAWALPSAGVVPFFQSMVCNIDDCQTETEFEDIPSYAGSSAQELVDNTMPLISDNHITELVSALPRGMRLVRVAVDALSGPDLSALLGNGFPVRNLLKDNNETRDLLQKQNMSTEDIDVLFNSSIQLPQMLEVMNERSFCDFAQDAQASNSSVFEKLRTSVCLSTESRRREFFLQLKNHLNVKNIVQTMGLAMSELGRLDISDILKNIGGLLSSVQSSDILSADIVTMLSAVLGQIRFENVDTEIISLLVSDLEPLYRHSEWAGLINILKDIRFPKPNVRSDRTSDGEWPEPAFEWNLNKRKDNVFGRISQTRRSDSFNYSSNILESVLELAGTGLDVARLFPQQNTSHVQNVLKYITFLVEITDDISSSLKYDNSSEFLNKAADVLGAVFLNIASPVGKENDEAKTTNWCDKREARRILDFSGSKNVESLQEYACRMSNIAAQDPKSFEDKERWKKAADSIRSIFSSDNLMQIRNNIGNWEEDEKPNLSSVEHSQNERNNGQKINDVEDFITAAECSIQGFKELPDSKETLNGSKVEGMTGGTSKKGDVEKILLSYVFGAKTAINDFKNHFLKNSGKIAEDAGNVLDSMNNMFVGIADSKQANDTSTTKDLLRFIPRLVAVIQNYNKSSSGLIDIPEFASAFVDDLEPVIWKSITEEEAMLFSLKNESGNFCIAPETLDTGRVYLHSLACRNEDSAFKLLMPKGERMKKLNSDIVLNYPLNSASFDTQTFSRTLLQLTSASGFVLKVAKQFLKPIDGCESACGTTDGMLKKMCFLGRLQNVKISLEQPEDPVESEPSFKNNDILMQLKPILGIEDGVLEAYESFMEVVESSAASNYSDYKDIVRLITSGLRLVESLDDGSHKVRPVLHVTSSLISLLKNRVADTAQYNTTSVVEIQNVFPGSPLTQHVVKSMLPVLPEIISTLFWTALAPGQFLHLVSESKRNVSVIMTDICNSSMSSYFYNPSLEKSTIDNLGSILCRHKYFDVFEEIFQDPDIQEIVFEADNTDKVAWDEMTENIQDIISLLSHLDDVRKADLSVIPPLPKWQMMALDIYSHLKDPSVILYVVNNKLFSDFCFKPADNSTRDLQNFVSQNSQEALYAELCSMSKQSFASKLFRSLNHTVHESVRNSAVGPNAVGMALVKEKFWETLLNVSEIKNVAKMIFEVDVLEAVKHEKSKSENGTGQNRKRFSKKFVEKLINATRRAFDMADSMTGNNLSPILLGTLIPEFTQDFAEHVEASDGVVDINKLVERGQGFEKFFQSILQGNVEKRRLESYIQTLSTYFSKKKNANHLTQLCNAARQTGIIKSSDYTMAAMCALNPNSWSIQNLADNRNLQLTWKQINKILDDDAINKTKTMFLEKRKYEFLDSIGKTLSSGIHVSDWTSLQKSSFYFSLMRSFVRELDEVNPEESGIHKPICITENTEVAFQDSVHKLLDSVPNAEFLTCGLLSKNISSFYEWISRSANIKGTVEKVTQEAHMKGPCAQTWNWLMKSVDDLEMLYNKLSQGLPLKVRTRISHCVGNFTHSPLMYSIQAHANVLNQVTKLLTGLAAPANQWKEVRERFSKRISQHLPVFLKISDIMSNQTSWLLEFAPSEAKTFMESSLNFNWLLRHGFSHTALMKRLCGDTLSSLRGIITFPLRTSISTRSKTKDFLCTNGTIEEIMETLDFETIKKKVLQMQEKEFFSGKWLQRLLNSSDVLVKIVEHIGSSLQEVEIHNVYNVFQLFTRPQVLQNLADSMSALMQVLEPVFTGSSLLDTLQQVMDGLKAFRSLTQLANFTFVYSVKYVFGPASEDVLVKELGVDPAAVSHLLNSEIDLKQASVSKDGKVTFCRSDDDNSPVCILSSNKQTVITREYLQDLVLQRFLYSFGTLGIEGVLREADVDAGEAGKTLEVLSSAPMVLSRLTNHLETVTSVMHPELKELFESLGQAAEWLATPEALSIGGQILCGKPLTSLSKKFSLLAPEDSENKIEDKELLRLPTDFCRYGYKEIMKMRGGAILWGFLKPLFRGKILYAPKNYSPAVRVISKVNETLKVLEEHIRFVKAAAEGSTGLHYVQRKSETLLSLQKFLASKSVSKLLGSASWGSTLSWLESTNTSTRSLLTLVELVGNVTECISLDRFIGFDTEAELEAAATTLHDRREFIAAIVFLEEKDAESSGRERRRTSDRHAKLPPKVHYKIRMDIDNVPTTEYIKYRWWRPYPYDDFFEDLRYFRGFIQLQDTVDAAIMSLHSETEELPPARKYLQQFPYPCHQRDKFGTLLKGSMPAVMTISWVFIVAFLVRERVLDRELELDETLRVMGLKQSAGWLAWFLTGLCVLLVSVIGIVAVLKWGGITPLSNPFVLFLFVADFAVLLIAYCQLMSSLFTRASTAALMSVLLYVLSFFPFLLFVTWELDFLYWQKLLSCVLVSTSFCFGCLYLNRYEDQGQGVQWSNLWLSPVIEDRMNFGTTLVTMALCSMFYFMVSWYVTRLWTGNREKRPLLWYFLLMPHPFKDKTAQIDEEDYKMRSISREGSDKTDAQPPKRTIGISMKSVHALYSQRGSKEWKALCGLNLDFYQDHITALLGHNGAGKTTTLKVLTGRLKPTAGSVMVSGYNFPGEISEARKLIGFCPQNNTLYDRLTVKEHLYLFAQLKGLLSPEQVEEDVNKMLENLNLVEKQDEPSDTLSGGQRRRLCVGIAFVGGSKIVILDEPTSSVDPVARRGIWDLILSYKTGRTILLTTHHLDEADILSDRVAILHKGRLLCFGSPLYLKCRFGSGYRLSLFPGADKSEDKDSGHDSGSTRSEELPIVDCDGVMDFIQTYVPDATLLENDDSHLVVSLPSEPLSSKPLSNFFAHLERSLHSWGFRSCSLSSATLDEVFLTLCRLEDAKAAHLSEKFTEVTTFSMKRSVDLSSASSKSIECHKEHINALAVDMRNKDNFVGTQSASFVGLSLKFSQLRSLIKKRYWHTKRNWKTLTSSIVMPCVFIALAMGLAVGRPQKSPDPSIELTPSLYATPEQKTVSFFAWNNPEPVGTALLEALKANVTRGKLCLQDHSKCHRNPDVRGAGGHSKWQSATGSRCLCETECPAKPLPSVPFLETKQELLLYNLSDVDVPKYLLDSYLEFNEKRYGGWSISERSHDVKVWFENSGYHSAPSHLNTLNNALLKMTSTQNHGIRTWSHPLRLSVEQLGRETLLQRLGEVGIAMVFLIGLSLVPSTFAVYIVGERESEQKRLQMVTGHLGPLMYWIAALIWDLAIVLSTSVLTAAIVAAFALPAFYERENFRAVYSLVFLYGWSTTPLTYLSSRFFREGSLAFMVIFTSHLFLGLVIMLSLVSLRMISVSKDVAVTLDLLQRVSLACPQYCLVSGLTDLNENQIRSEIFAQFGQDVYISPFGWNSLGPNYVALFLQGVVFFLLTLVLEMMPLRHWIQRLTVRHIAPRKPSVQSISENCLLQVQNVSQIYRCKAGNKYALNDLSLTVPEGECFGLVGANGAGKTTLFRLLIGEDQPISGKILHTGLQSKAIPKHCFLGYCPQKDALDGLLTPRQHLEVYAGLRGIETSLINKVVERSLQSLELTVHADFPVDTLSGGTKRKLCTAIASLGDPELILLDEPTSGMDPATRRLVWRCISRATEAGRSVVLTSHSIEDCDVLCTKLGIMVNGRIACLDSPVKLKSRLGNGYTMSFRIPEGKQDWPSLFNFIHKVMPFAQLQVRSGRRIELSLPDETVTLSSLFCHLEECAQHFGIEDLAIDPTTLDQVFVNFVRKQSDATQRLCDELTLQSTNSSNENVDSTKL